jgi:hypothetical protein
MQVGRKRPLGVTIVEILMIINGIILVASGVFGVSAAGLLGTDLGSLAGTIAATSSIVIALGVASLIIAWGSSYRKRLGADCYSYYLHHIDNHEHHSNRDWQLRKYH